MKILRTFMRVDKATINQEETLNEWCTRIDSLLCADIIELNTFMCDAVMAVAVKSGKSIEEVTEVLAQACLLENADSVLELIQGRWNNIIAYLTEHADVTRTEAMDRLADQARKADWE